VSADVAEDSSVVDGTPQPQVFKIIKKMEYELLCPQHNPVSIFSSFILSFKMLIDGLFLSLASRCSEESQQN
jgi:hypothetical protein